MKKKYISLGFILLMVLLIFSSCSIAQDKYDAVVSERDAAEAEAASLQSDLDAAQAEAASLQSDLDAAQAEAASLQSDLDSLIDEKEDLQNELNAAIYEKDALLKEFITTVNVKDTLLNELYEIKAIYPPGQFNSVSELENWVSTNKQPSTNDLESLFMAALEVQQLGLQDGYLISVIYDEDYRGPGYPWVFNGALVNGSFYVWDPGTGNFYYWYADIF